MSENYFKDFMTAKGLSQYRVAKDTGLNAMSVNRWYHGRGMRKACAMRLKAVYPDFDIAKINENWA